MRRFHPFLTFFCGGAEALMLRTPILIALLALTPLAAAAETATLQFEVEALDLETGAVVEVIAGLPTSLDADFHFAYHARRTPHAVLVPNDFAGVEISFLNDTPFNLISEGDVPLLTFTPDFPDQPFESGDTAVLKTASGAYFKVGNAAEDELSVQFDCQLLVEPLAAIDSLQTAPRLASTGPSALSSGLAQADWQEIRSLLDRHRYLIANRDRDNGPFSRNLEAENPAHRLRATFASGSVSVASLETARDSWTWSLALIGYGYGEKLLAPEPPDIVASDNRIEYRRGEITEWYVNDERGLEQGFSLAKAPPGHGKQSLRISLNLGGSLAARPGAQHDEILLAEAGSEHRLRYGGLVAWDATGRDLPARMVLGDRTLTLEVDDRSAVYPITVDPTIEYLSRYQPTEGPAYTWFGYSVSVSGDTVLVGAPNTSIRDPYNPIYAFGVAYVFVNQDETWVQQARLLAPDWSQNDYFGIAVSLWGDTALIGAHGADGEKTNCGAAYVYVRTGDTWTLEAKLVAENPWKSDNFGGSVSLSEDTALIGASAYPNELGYRWYGTAYAFERQEGAWAQRHRFPRRSCSLFGGTVDVSGDTAIIGHQGGIALANCPAHVYTRSEITWSLQEDLLVEDLPYGNYHAFAVALSGDTAFVGAPGEGCALGSACGSVYVYVRDGVTWSQQARLRPSDGGYWHDRFGAALSVSADHAIVGVNNWTGPGSAYVFVREPGGWMEQAKLLAADGASGDRFGWSVAVEGETAVVGAARFVDFPPNSGAFYAHGLVTNEPPVCVGPASLAAECAGAATAIVGLDGSMSGDPDDDPLAFSWTTNCPGGVFDDATKATPVLTVESTTGVCEPLSCFATLTVGDDSGEENTCEPTLVEIEDTLAPTVVPEASPATLECGVDSYTEAGATATDVCDPVVPVTIGGDEVATEVVGSYTRSYDAADDCGNAAVQATRTVSVVDTLPPDVVVLGPTGLTLECGVDSYSEAGATAADACDPDVPLVIGGDEVDTEVVGSYTRAYDAADDSGNSAVQAIRTVSVVDTLAPSLVLPEPTAITVTDADCSGDEPASLAVASATDACDPNVPVSNDAPDTFPAGATTTVTYVAVDDSGNPSTAGVDVTVLFGANIAIRAIKHTVGPGTYPGASKEPLVGIEVCGYDKAEGGCARTTCGGISHHQYPCILDTCAPVNAGFNEACCTTDATGECTINGPPGEYLFISGDPTGATLPDPLGGVSELACGESKKNFLQQIVRVDGKKMPGKTSIRTGSELLIIEPEFVEWDETEESYPVVFDSVDEWSAEAAVMPPEGFVSDYDNLSEHVDNELEAVQFLLTDIGSDWVPTETRYTLEHQGRTEVVLSRIGVRLSEALARAKGLDRSGRPLAADGAPQVQRGFDPRGEWPAEIVGWIEPSGPDQLWTVKLAVSRDTDLEVSITRGDGQLVEVLASSPFEPGEYSFTWGSTAAQTGRYFVSLTAGDLSQKVMLTELEQ